MLQVVDAEKPPLRLLLGIDALGLLEKKQQSFQSELAPWRHISEDTTLEGVTASAIGG